MAATLLHAGTVDLLVAAGGTHRDDFIIAADLCTAIGGLAIAATPMAGDKPCCPAAEALADGSAAALVLMCLEKHVSRAVDAEAETGTDAKAAARVAPRALEALKRLALSRAFVFHSPAGLQSAVALLGHVAVGEFSSADDHDDADSVDAPRASLLGPAALTLALLGKAVPAASSACTAAILSLPPAAQSQRAGAAIYWSAAHGSAAELRASIANGAGFIGDADSWSFVLQLAAFRGRLDMVDVLMGRFTNPDAAMLNVDLAARIAASRGDVPLLEHLLTRWRADPAANDDKLLCLAAANGHVTIVDRLLQEDSVYSSGSGFDGAGLWMATRNGHLPVLERLLADPRADPSANNNAAVLGAAIEGHLPVLTRLLADERVDPHEGSAMRTPLAAAARGGHVDIIRALMDDPRVDAAGYMRAELDPDTPGRVELPLSSRFALQCRPAVLRVIMEADFDLEVTPDEFPQGFAPASVRDLQAAAWRRRRAAVLAWATA